MGKIACKFNKLVAFLEKKAGRKKCISRPGFAHFLTQYECNYNCEFCGFDYRTNPLKTQLTIDKYQKILEHLHPGGLANIVFSGMGEPLLCNDFEKIVLYTKEKYPHIKLMINSNGELLTGNKLRFAAKYLDNIVISLHSLEPKTYAAISGNKSLQTVLDNIRTLRDINPGLPLTFYFAYSMHNITEISRHIDFCYENGNSFFLGAYAKFYSCRRCFSALEDSHFFHSLDRELSLFNHQEYSDQMVNEAVQRAKNIGLNKFIFPPLFSNKLSKRATCSFPYEQIMIGPEGQIYPCGGSEVLMYEEIRDGKLNFGNILNADIDKIWNLEDYQRLRESCLGNSKCRTIEYCENCTTLSFFLDSGNVRESHFVENIKRVDE